MPKSRKQAVWVMFIALMVMMSVSAHAWEQVSTVGSASPGSSARGVALSPDEKYVFIAGVQDMALWKFDRATGARLASVSLSAINPGAYGKAVFVTQDGHVWAPATVPELYRFDSDLNLVARYDLRPFGIQNPEGAVVLADDAIVVTDRRGSVGLYKLQIAGEHLELVPGFGTNGHVALGSDIRQPAISTNGQILVADYASSEGVIYRVDPNTGAVSTFATGVTDPYHLAADALGRVYVVQYSASPAVTVLDATGAVLTVRSKQELGITTEASGVAVSADGSTIYILDQRPSQGGTAHVYSIN